MCVNGQFYSHKCNIQNTKNWPYILHALTNYAQVLASCSRLPEHEKKEEKEHKYIQS